MEDCLKLNYDKINVCSIKRLIVKNRRKTLFLVLHLNKTIVILIILSGFFVHGLFINIYVFIYLFIFGCVGSSFLCEGFL